MSSSRTRERVARNFIKTYGKQRFRRLIDCFSAQKSGQCIANEFGVSRERVRQWKDIFGTTITFYQVHPEVEGILQKQPPPRRP